MIQNGGTQAFTADGAVGASGTAVRVFNFSFLSGGTAAVVSLRNGTSASATAYVTKIGVINDTVSINFGTQGMLFPSGCFVDVDGNTTIAVVTFNYAS